MSHKFTKAAIFIFSLIGFLHALRLFFGWEAVIGGLNLPLWLSGVALALAALMVWGLSKES